MIDEYRLMEHVGGPLHGTLRVWAPWETMRLYPDWSRIPGWMDYGTYYQAAPGFVHWQSSRPAPRPWWKFW